LRLAGWLLALETIGALLLLVGGDYVQFNRVAPVKAAGVLLGALLGALLLWRVVGRFCGKSRSARQEKREWQARG